MKRKDLLKHLAANGCGFVREGCEHSIWQNPVNRRRTSIPRHREIVASTAQRICKQLDVPLPKFA